jgi:hypothetical protein
MHKRWQHLQSKPHPDQTVTIGVERLLGSCRAGDYGRSRLPVPPQQRHPRVPQATKRANTL